jgi:hypothetical protein
MEFITIPSEQVYKSMIMTTSCRNPSRHGIRSPAPSAPFPATIPPLLPENEKKINFALMKDLKQG